MAMNFRPKRREAPEINLTPLIDVVFLLLIFFMVSTTFDRQRELGIELPEAREAELKKEKESVLEVGIDATGKIFVDGVRLADERRETVLQALSAARDKLPDAPVQIAADGEASYKLVVLIMDVGAELGIGSLRLPVLAPEGGKSNE